MALLTARPVRRFTILDGMIFVAASAVGLTVARSVEADASRLPPGARPIQYWIWSGPPSCLAFACGLALILARSVPPRPRWRRIARQPGFVASIMAVWPFPIFTLYAMMGASVERPTPGSTFSYSFDWLWGTAAFMVPVSVGGAWVALGLSGRWRPEASWVDRAGRALGFFWLASWPVWLIQPVLKYAFPDRF